MGKKHQSKKQLRASATQQDILGALGFKKAPATTKTKPPQRPRERTDHASSSTVTAKTPPPTPKSRHGGAREGAGRKSRGEGAAKVTKSTRMTGEEFARFKQNLRDGESWAEYIRRLLRQDAKVQELRRKQRGDQT